MPRLTRFPARAAGPAERLSGFVAHLRLNGLPAGPGETALALEALAQTDATDSATARLALRAALTGDADRWRRFDALFDAYWYRAGAEREGAARTSNRDRPRPALWQRHLADPADGDETSAAPGRAHATEAPGGPEAEGAEGRLLATRTEALGRRDLRELVDPEDLAEAERIAERLARAIRDRRSRRHRATARGRRPDLRRVLRRSLARGGDPVDLAWRRRPDRPVRIVALCDVSGSMAVYARVFLAFLKGLAGADRTTETYVFHTRLMRVSEALRDRDGLRAAARLSLIAEGFGGGTDIGGCLADLAATGGHGGHGGHGARLTRRTVVLVLSDGCCTGTPDRLAGALVRLRRRVGRVVWLNPLLGWRDYAPVAAGISAALPHLDAHLPANTLAALAALEPEFERL